MNPTKPELPLSPAIREMKEINRLNDQLFKFLFAREENKSLLIGFLNSVLDASRQIEDVVYLDRESAPVLEGGKIVRFDVRASAIDGRIFHVEVQVASQPCFFERCLYYTSHSYINQLLSGDLYIGLKPVILVGILNFNQFGWNEGIHSCFQLIEKEKHICGTDALEFHFFELPKLEKSKDKLASRLWRWLRYLSSRREGSDEEMQRIAQEEPLIYEAIRQEDLFRKDPEKLFKYMQHELDQAVYEYSLKLSKEEGIAEGEAIGKAEGKAEGKVLGKLEIVRNMLLDGIPMAQAVKYSGLPEIEVRKIAESIKSEG